MAQPRVYREGDAVSQAQFLPSASSGGCPSMGAPAASRPMAAGSVSTISFPEQGLHSRLRDKLNRSATPDQGIQQEG